jgi:hypothetical protein
VRHSRPEPTGEHLAHQRAPEPEAGPGLVEDPVLASHVELVEDQLDGCVRAQQAVHLHRAADRGDAAGHPKYRLR